MIPDIKQQLRYVQIETTTTCNQRCHFCPVSVSKRPKQTMSMPMFEKIVSGIEKFNIEIVYLNGFNEPSYDKQLTEKVLLLQQRGMAVHLNSNASGLTSELVQQLLGAGVRSFTINLSTLDEQQFIHSRGSRDVSQVLKHTRDLLQQCIPYNAQVNILILGDLDLLHVQNINDIREFFSLALESSIICPISNFAGGSVIASPKQKIFHKKVLGCESKRDTQWLHFTPAGDAILCCQDYPGNYKVGNIETSSPEAIYQGSLFTQLRDKISGVEDTADDFICHSCIFAIGEEGYPQKMQQMFCQRCELPGQLGESSSCQQCVVNPYRVAREPTNAV